jgi:cardiolipin synthase
MQIVLVVLVTFSVTVLVLFLIQNLSSGQRNGAYQIAPFQSLRDPTFERSMSSLLGPPLVGGNRITCLLNGDEIFPSMLASIRAAEKTITFETYIYWSGTIGQEMSTALSERARAGVRVHVLLDWVGSSRLDSDSLEMMRGAGVEVERYCPPHWYNLSRLNNRTHRKITVIDGKVGYIGGVGIADHWLGNAQSPENWRDSHFKLEGPAVAQLQSAFMDNWIKTRAEVLHQDDYFPALEPVGSMRAQTFKSSPREGSDSVRLMYLLTIAAAQQRILLANSYFVPDDLTIDSLIAARKRGVQVEIIVPGPYVDTHVTRRASRSLWGKLLEADIAIYEYQPTMYHCKVMVVDDLWVSVGSTNFDNRSFCLNDEANLNILDAEFAEEQANIFEQDKQRARRVTLKEWQHRPWHEKLIEASAGLLRSQV